MMMAMFSSSAVVSMTLFTPVPSGCSSLADAVGGEGAPAVGEVAGVDLGGPVQQERDDDSGDGEQHQPRRTGVRSEEPGAPVLPLGRVLDPDDHEGGQRQKHGHGEEVLEEPDELATGR